MSVQRTPPSSSTNLVLSEVITDGSDTQLNTLEHQDNLVCVTRRMKKKRDDKREDITTTLMPEITNLFEQFEKRQSSKLETLFSNVTEQNSVIQNSIEFLSLKYDDFLQRMEHLEIENSSYKKKIEFLETKLEQMERNTRSSMIEIKNVPKQPSESKEDLRTIISKIGDVIKKPISSTDVRDVYRLKTKNPSSNHIIVDFTTVTIKAAVIKKCREYNKTNMNSKLNTSNIGFNNTPQPIYIEESLTKMSRRMYYLAREFVKENKHYTCWTSYGKVFIKEKDKHNALVIRINTEEDIRKISAK